MKLTTLFVSALVLVINTARAAVPPEICMVNPAISLEPGTIVSARLQSQGKRCGATVTFTNPDFLPLRYGFNALDCLGFLSAEFTIPPEVPNGDAFILWECADQSSPTCIKAVITGGSQDASKIKFNKYGRISCLVPIATETTLSTSTGTATTVTNAIVATVFSTSTPLSDAAASAVTDASDNIITQSSDTSNTNTLASDASNTNTLASDANSPASGMNEASSVMSVVPISTETIISTSIGASTTVTNTMLSTLFSTSTLMPRATRDVPLLVETILSTSIGISTTVTNTLLKTLSPTSPPVATQMEVSDGPVLWRTLTTTVTAACMATS